MTEFRCPSCGGTNIEAEWIETNLGADSEHLSGPRRCLDCDPRRSPSSIVTIDEQVEWTESTVDAFARALADGDPDGRLGKDGEDPPPCPRCGEPTFKVWLDPERRQFVWGHGCEPETFSDMAPGWRL